MKTGRAIQFNNPVLQTWWVVEKCVESPESDRVFSHVVGVIKKPEKDLRRQYEQRKVLVLTEKIDSKKGIALDWKPTEVLTISSIDYKYEIFPGWD